jgi:steroid delta-isomerase-like uncharacterized protein
MASCRPETSDREGKTQREGTSMSAENEALVRRYVEEVYDQRKLEIVDEIFAPDFTLHDPDLPGAERGPEGIKRIVRTFVDAFPDLEVSLDDEMSSGDKVITRWTARGTQQGELMGIAPTGNRIDVTTISIWRVADGKIAEAWLVYDAFGMMQQLGLAPSREGNAPPTVTKRCSTIQPQRYPPERPFSVGRTALGRIRWPGRPLWG